MVYLYFKGGLTLQDIDISNNTIVNPLGRELFIKGTNNTAVLLIHGFTGYTDEMRYLAQRIFDECSYSVYIPRLPGHGTNKDDFRNSTARDWLRKTYDSYLNIKDNYSSVYLIGLSMGGLLSLLTASRFNIDKLVLISPSLYTYKFIAHTHILKHIIPVIKKNKDTYHDKLNSENLQFLRDNYSLEYYTKQISELHKLMILSRRVLRRINNDTLILASKADKRVPLKAAYKIKDSIKSSNKKLYIFENSPHVINNGPDREECANIIIEWLR
jgi:carboxylesterase